MRLRRLVLLGVVGACAGCAVVQIHREAVLRIPSGELAVVHATTFATLTGLGYGPGTRMRQEGPKTFEVPRDNPNFTYEVYRPTDRSALLAALRVTYQADSGSSDGRLVQITVAWQEVGAAPDAVGEAERRLREIGERLRSAFQKSVPTAELSFGGKETVLRFRK